MTSNKKIIDDATFNELLAKDAENAIANLRIFIDSLDWSGLIAQAMACNPEPLKAALIEIGDRKDLCPGEMRDFLALMEEHKPRQGRPKKDGKDDLRAASKAWHRALLRDSYYALAYLYEQAKKYDAEPLQRMEVTAYPRRVNVRLKKDGKGQKLVRLNESNTPSQNALEMLADAAFGPSEKALEKLIYSKKKR